MRAWPRSSALIAGAVLAAALPPLHLLPALITFAWLLTLADEAPTPGGAMLRGWLFGLGYFLAGLYWIGIAFFTDAERFGALAVPAVVLLAAFLALVPAIVMYVYRRVAPTTMLAKVLLLGSLWAVGEMLRGSLGLWFPWNPIASVWGGLSWMMQPIAWIGPHLLGLVTVAASAAFASIWTGSGTARWKPAAIATICLAGLALAGSLRLMAVVPEDGNGTNIRIVQANISQHHKWDQEKVNAWFFRHVEMSAEENGADPPDVVVWPESAVPYRLEYPETRQAIVGGAPFEATWLMGSDYVLREGDTTTLHNSLYVMNGGGEVDDRYDKVNLVPFGEFLPVRGLLSLVGLEKLTPGSSDFIPGPGRRTIEIPSIPSFSPLICYEAIFPAMASARDAWPHWLVNITNDAWFGISSGPYQHLTMARMRAIEEGVPLVRAANTGISTVTDAFGKQLETLELGETGIIDAPLPGRLQSPPLFRRAPWAITAAGVIGCIAIALAASRRERPPHVVGQGREHR